MNEFEIKFLGIDVAATTKRLIDLGAKKTFEGEIKPSFFMKKNSPMKAKGQSLRLRTKGDKTELTLKQRIKNKDAKLSIETEVLVSDYDTMKKILEKLGYKQTIKPSKHRTTYSLGKYNFEFDTFPGLPTFLEVEAQSIDELKKAVQMVGFNMKDGKPWSGKDVVKFYNRK